MLKDPVRCGPVRVAGVAVRVWPRVWPGVAGVRTGKKGGARGGPPLCGVQAAVSYSPTPWRVQYHRRWQS